MSDDWGNIEFLHMFKRLNRLYLSGHPGGSCSSCDLSDSFWPPMDSYGYPSDASGAEPRLKLRVALNRHPEIEQIAIQREWLHSFNLMYRYLMYCFWQSFFHFFLFLDIGCFIKNFGQLIVWLIVCWLMRDLTLLNFYNTSQVKLSRFLFWNFFRKQYFVFSFT